MLHELGMLFNEYSARKKNETRFERLKVVVYNLPIPKYSDDFTVFNPLAFRTDLNIP